MGEHQIVLAAHDRGPERRRLLAVPSEPVTEVEVVDGIVGVAIAAQTVYGHPTQHASDQIDQVVKPARIDVRGNRGGEAREERGEGSVDRHRAPGTGEPPCSPVGQEQQLLAHGQPGSTVEASAPNMTLDDAGGGGDGEMDSVTAGTRGRPKSSET